MCVEHRAHGCRVCGALQSGRVHITSHHITSHHITSHHLTPFAKSDTLIIRQKTFSHSQSPASDTIHRPQTPCIAAAALDQTETTRPARPSTVHPSSLPCRPSPRQPKSWPVTC